MMDQNDIELRWVFAVLRRWWKLIAGLGLLGALIGFVATALMPPVYQASALLLVNPSKSVNSSDYNNLMAGTQLALTYSQMITDRPVLEAAMAELNMKGSTDALAKRVTADPVRNSQIIKLTVEDSNPQQAAVIANALAQAFSKRIEQLSTQRYAGAIQNAKSHVDDLQRQMKAAQTQVDSIRSQKVTKEVDLANQQTALATDQSDYHALQSSYQQTQLAVAEVTGKIYIVEPVQVQKDVKDSAGYATAVVSIGQSQTSAGNNLSGDQLALTYGQLIIKPPLLDGVIKDLGLTDTTDSLSKRISFDLVTGTQLVRFKITDDNADRAGLIAQSLVNAFVSQVKAMLAQPYADRLDSMQKQIKAMEVAISTTQTAIGKLTSDVAQMAGDLDRLDSDLGALRSDYRAAQQNYEDIQTTAAATSDAVIITEPAHAPKQPKQNRMLYIVIAAFLGLAIGTASTFFMKYFDGQILNDHDVQTALSLPVFSTIGKFSTKGSDLVMGSEPASAIAEDFRILGNKLRLIHDSGSLKSLLITSPIPSEGKSIVASNLAIGLSTMGLKVVIVDADLRLPRLHNLFGVSQQDGLANSLIRGNINGTLQSTSIDALKIVTSGEVPPNPAELLSSPALVKLIQELEGKADLVLIDCPPLMATSDASILASKVDGVLLVLRAGYSESNAARNAIEALRQVKANLIGVVLNSVPKRKTTYYRYYHQKPQA